MHVRRPIAVTYWVYGATGVNCIPRYPHWYEGFGFRKLPVLGTNPERANLCAFGITLRAFHRVHSQSNPVIIPKRSADTRPGGTPSRLSPPNGVGPQWKQRIIPLIELRKAATKLGEPRSPRGKAGFMASH